MLTGTTLGYIAVVALLAAAILMAFLDKKEKAQGETAKAKFLSRTALVLFIAAFIGGLGVTLVHGTRPREEGGSMTGRPMGGGSGAPGGAIGQVNEEEVKALEAKVEKDPNDVASRERLGHLYLQMQNFEKVFLMSHQVLQKNPNSPESLVHLGMVLFAMQKTDEALDQFNAALKSDPNFLEALLFKGIVQFQGKDDLKGAKATWDHFMKIAKPTDTGYNRVQMFLQNINQLLSQKP